MWIQTTNITDDGDPVTKRLSVEGFDRQVEFSSTGKAQVPQDIGEFLLANVESIERASDSDGVDESTDDSDGVDDSDESTDGTEDTE